MNFNIVHILVIVSVISGVIGLNNTKLSIDDSGVIINGKNASDVPAATTVNSANITQLPTTTPPEPTPTPTTVTPPTTTPSTPVTTPTTEKPTTTTVPPTIPTTAPPTHVTTTTEGTTTTTITSTTAAPAHKGRHFDGPSFIGGIILASGLMAIGFVSWKFYKARTEPPRPSQGHTQ